MITPVKEEKRDRIKPKNKIKYRLSIISIESAFIIKGKDLAGFSNKALNLISSSLEVA
ncbi:hypothetical protein HS141_13915 [Cetobacterium somerae]|uniref:hypothetical protein n=1 Tax=Cetobacterium somerae TaxID=188913 RepID=UPI00211EB045|nr:hypothetical protein [Cetobacterium somerae]MCQ9628021.1 hypothetical protein [Cetobacterium somerae]